MADRFAEAWVPRNFLLAIDHDRIRSTTLRRRAYSISIAVIDLESIACIRVEAQFGLGWGIFHFIVLPLFEDSLPRVRDCPGGFGWIVIGLDFDCYFCFVAFGNRIVTIRRDALKGITDYVFDPECLLACSSIHSWIFFRGTTYTPRGYTDMSVYDSTIPVDFSLDYCK